MIKKVAEYFNRKYYNLWKTFRLVSNRTFKLIGWETDTLYPIKTQMYQ